VRRHLVHTFRVALVLGLFVLVHWKHRQYLAANTDSAVSHVSIAQVQAILPAAATLAPGADTRDILNANGERIGFCLTTSPAGDESIGFSGPTNVLIVCDSQSRIVGLSILSSRDTREHAAQVRRHPKFLASYAGLTLSEAAGRTHVDAVAGATLTSDAIVEAILRRLGVATVSVKFPEPVTLAEARSLFAAAAALELDVDEPEISHIYDARHVRLGSCLRTAPAGDNKIGYQGPTEALVGFDTNGRVVGFILRKSYDNAEYVETVRGDDYFRHIFDHRTRAELSQVSPQQPDVEGVSGSTMTSLAVAEAIVAAAKYQHPAHQTANQTRVFTIVPTDYGVVAMIVIATVLAFSRLRGNRWVRVAFALTTVSYLGYMTATLLSQAQFVGWAQAGVPRGAFGLAILTCAAVLLPISTKRNVYCSHLCPHGAAQQLVQLVARPQVHVGRPWRRMLGLLPVLLLIAVVMIALRHWPISLVDLEPFDAYVPEIAGYAALGIAVVGLIASCFVPLAYCRYGCPTGALLEFVRRHAQSDRFTRRDAAAVVLFVIALVWFCI